MILKRTDQSNILKRDHASSIHRIFNLGPADKNGVLHQNAGKPKAQLVVMAAAAAAVESMNEHRLNPSEIVGINSVKSTFTIHAVCGPKLLWKLPPFRAWHSTQVLPGTLDDDGDMMISKWKERTGHTRFLSHQPLATFTQGMLGMEPASTLGSLLFLLERSVKVLRPPWHPAEMIINYESTTPGDDTKGGW